MVTTRRAGKRIAKPAEPAIPPLRRVGREEGMAMLDRRARRSLGISGTEFIRRWEAGEYAADPDQPGVIETAMLLPFVRGIFPASDDGDT